MALPPSPMRLLQSEQPLLFSPIVGETAHDLAQVQALRRGPREHRLDHLRAKVRQREFLRHRRAVAFSSSECGISKSNLQIPHTDLLLFPMGTVVARVNFEL